MNQRGVALPMALVILMVLTSLMVAFGVLATTEPIISANHMRGARARSLAESGIERALWGLSTGVIPDTIAAGDTAASPYDGSIFLALNTEGGFMVKVSKPVTAPVNEMLVEAIGWAPNNNPTDTHPKGVKKIETMLMRIRSLDPPCALCVQGELEMAGSAKVDARAGHCSGGPAPTAGTVSAGATYVGGNAKVYGPDDNVPNEPVDTAQMAPPATFDFKWTDEEIAFLKSLAKANGAYYKGAVTFNSSNKLKPGIVFVDTISGAPFTAASDDADAAFADVHGGATDCAECSDGWPGWLIVAGSVSISGNVKINGLVYAQNDLSYRGTGTGQIIGAVISENRKDTIASTIEATAEGNADIIFDCQNVRDGGGTVPQGWFVKAGSYKEIEGSTF